MKLVPDASVVIKWFVLEELHEEARRLFPFIGRMRVPDLLAAEVSNIVWKKSLRGELLPGQAELITTSLPNYFQNPVTSNQFIAKALDLAITLRHPVYDCLYLACAQQEKGKQEENN